jgi:hypothetical protein
MSALSSRHLTARLLRRRRSGDGGEVRWQREVPQAISSLDTFAAPDYADIVTAPVGETPSKTPEQWARATVKGVPRVLLVLVPLIQRAILGLRLELRSSPDHILGWKIADRGERWVRLEASSWLLTGHVLVHIGDEQLYFATFLRYNHRLAKLVWPPVSLIHRQVALTLARSAIRDR